MAILIDGDARTFRAAVYGRPDERRIEFLQRQFEDPTRALNYADREFYGRARSLFEDNYGEAALARIDVVRSRLRGAWDPNSIHRLETVEQFQSTGPLMQRWMMANPFIRRQYLRGAVHGYGESYIDLEAKKIGADHYDYCLVMDGVGVMDDTEEWVATTYGVELLEGDNALEFEEKLHILDSWTNAEHHLNTGDRDITSQEDNKWG